MIADNLDIDGEDWALDGDNDQGSALWQPQNQHEAGTWPYLACPARSCRGTLSVHPGPRVLARYSARGQALTEDLAVAA